MLSRACLRISFPAVVCAMLTSCALPAKRDDTNNGISVQVQIYNTHQLQNDIKTLSAKLGQVSLIDQASLIGHLGGIQGAESTQFAMNLQATGLATPSVSTTTTNGTPSIAQTLGNTVSSGTPTIQTTGGASSNTSTPQVQQTVNSGTPAVGTTPATPPSTQTITTTVANTSGTTSQTVTSSPGTTSNNSNQTVTTTPSNTVQAVTAIPSTTPTIPALPSVTPLATPATPSPSTLDLLGEQMQASYAIIGLRAMMSGAESDDYTPLGKPKRHVTYGFPISVLTPKQYKGATAEVEISICNPVSVLEDIAPTVQLMLPQEKTYNVASMVSSSAALGVGAVIGGVVNVGGNFSWTHQTFYIVKQQDTISVLRDHPPKVSPCARGKTPVTFAWQFRPVLGQKTIDPDPRMTYALLAFPPTDKQTPDALKTRIALRRCWRKFDVKTGIVGDRIANSCVPGLDLPPETIEVTSAFDTLAFTGIDATDNGNGTITTTIHGHFPSGTRVGLGEAYLDESIPGFENNGKYLRFTSTTQVLAVRGARLLSTDGSIRDVQLTGPSDEPINHVSDSSFFANGHFQGTPHLSVSGQFLTTDWNSKISQLSFTAPDTEESDWRPKLTLTRIVNPGLAPQSCIVPYAHSAPRAATVRPYSDTQVEVTVPIWQCMDVGSISAPTIYVVVMGGKAFGLSDAPFKSSSADHLTFVVPNSFVQGLTTLTLKRLFFDDQYAVEYALKPPVVSVSGISVARTTLLDATFALTGSGLNRATFVYPWSHRHVECCDTYALVTLSADELTSVKALILKPDDGSTPPISIALPPAKLMDAEFDSGKAKYAIALVQKADDRSTYAITAIQEAAALKGTQILQPKPSATTSPDDRHLVFDLPAAQATAYKEVIFQLQKDGKPTDLVTLALPAPPKADDSSSSKSVSLVKDSKGLSKGATGTYTIKGSNLQLITLVSYFKTPLPFHLGPDASSLIVEQLPANFTANVGQVPLDVRTSDGTEQVYEVPVK
jgi:hypothetical protein